MRTGRSSVSFWAILAIALIARLAVGAWWQSRLPDGERFGFGDSDSYWALARSVAEGRPYEYGSPPARVFRTPGYPIVLAPLFWIGGDNPPAAFGYALSAVLGTLAVGGVYWLSRMMFDAQTGRLAALLAALYPGAIAQGALVLSEASFCPLMLAQLLLWTMADQTPSSARRRWLLLSTGILAGLASLTRPSWLLFTPIAAVLSLVVPQPQFPTRHSPRATRHASRLLDVALVLIGLTAAMSPWWIRNFQVTGHSVPTTLQVGASLYDGLNPQADGSSEMSFVDRFVPAERQSEADAIARGAPPADTFEYRLDQRMRQAAIDWAADHPLRAVQLAGIKLLRTWNIWPNEPGLRSWPLRLAVALTYVPLLITGICGAVVFTRRPPPLVDPDVTAQQDAAAMYSRLPTPVSRLVASRLAPVLCWLPAVYFSLLHMVFVGSIRYREPAMLCLIVLAAGAVDYMWRLTGRGTSATAKAEPAIPGSLTFRLSP